MMGSKRAPWLAALLLGAWGIATTPGYGQDAAANGELASALQYARWAEDALAGPPEGVQFLDGLEARLEELIARRRSEAEGDLAGLETDPGLQRAARAHALDMLIRDYRGHVGPDGRDASDRVSILARRFVGMAGENLAGYEGMPADALEGQIAPLAQRLVDGWMNSPGHRKNLLDSEYTHQGIGAAAKRDRLSVVHVFGARRALLQEPVPLRVRPGEKLPLSFAAGSPTTPEQYGYADPDRPDGEFVPLELSSNEVAVDPGTYRLEFLLPTDEADVFEVADGPTIVVEGQE